MTQTPIPRLVTTLAVPTIISMLVTAVYNMADTFFVAQLGTSAAGAVGIVFSLMAVIQAIGFMLGMGAGNLVSRYLGAKEQRQADCAASTAFFTALAFGLGITVLGTLFLDPLMRVLGATPTILPYARDYARYILFGAPVMCASFVLNNILRGEGKAMLAMVGIGLGGVLNHRAGPAVHLYVRAWHRGRGHCHAAQPVRQLRHSSSVLSAPQKRGAPAHRAGVPQGRGVRAHHQNGHAVLLPPISGQCGHGAAERERRRLRRRGRRGHERGGTHFHVRVLVHAGIRAGLPAVAGYNFGAKRYDRVRGATYFTMLVGTVLMSVLAAAGFLAAPGALALFRRDDAEVIAIGALRCGRSAWFCRCSAFLR